MTYNYSPVVVSSVSNLWFVDCYSALEASTPFHLHCVCVRVCVCVCVYKVASPFLPVWIPGVVYVADGKQRLRGGISSTHQAFREETREDH